MGITFNNVTIGAVQMEVFNVPSVPTIGTASRVSGSGTEIDLTYTASASNGGLPITSYTAVSTPGSITGTISQASSGTIRVSGLTQGTGYTFVVYATSVIGNSPNSAASNSVIPSTVPTAPTIGTASRVGGSGTELDVSYTAPLNDGGRPITSYTAISTPGSITGTISQASSGTIRVSGLTQGTNYTFVVYATNENGNSSNSAASNSIAPSIVATAPTIGTVIRVSGSGTQLDVPYTASSSNGGNAITSYTAVSTPSNITGTISQASSGTIRVNGLTQGTNYTFVVYATNSVGNSPNSAASNSIAPAVVPDAPTIGTPLNVSGSSTSIDVVYTASSSNGGNAITSYTAVSTPGSITGTISQASSGTIRVSGLTQGTSYTFVVYATNVIGNSPNSAASSSIYAGQVPTAPTIGTAIRVSGNSTQIDVPYTASSSNGGFPITSYTAVSTPGSITGTISQASSGTIRVSGLTQGTSYTFVVYATNVIGNSPNSAASNSIIPAVAPNAPTIGTPLNVSGSGTSIDVVYTAPANNGGLPITSYTAISTPGSLTGTVSQASSGNVRVSGLTQGTSYTFVVYATNPIGNSPNSSASSAIIAATVPTAPIIGTATILSNTSVSVSYTASSSNGGSTITSYTAVSTPGSITASVSQASSGTITVTGLTQGTSYTFVVYATNSVGNSPNSAATSAVVPAVVPSQATVGAVTSSVGLVSVAFTAPANGGNTITTHTAVSYPDYITASVSQASSGTITFENSSLVRNEVYSFRVYATNGIGNGALSTPSSSITYAGTPSQEASYITPGSYTWVAPTGVTSVSVVAVGGGGGGGSSGCTRIGRGGGGGGLGYINAVTVTGGSSYTVVVGAAGQQPWCGPGSAGGTSYFANTSTLTANGGNGGLVSGSGVTPGGIHTASSSFGTKGGGNGGSGGAATHGWESGGGGGAAGYSGNGGNGGPMFASGSNGTGGGAGGGAGGYYQGPGGNACAAAGGGTGLYGEGPSGAGGVHANGASHANGGGVDQVGNLLQMEVCMGRGVQDLDEIILIILVLLLGEQYVLYGVQDVHSHQLMQEDFLERVTYLALQQLAQ